MISHRSTHYWLWFLLFGVVAALMNFAKGIGPTSETIWLGLTGLLGLILGGGSVAGRLSRPFDMIIGLLFTGMGLLGILVNVGLSISAGNLLTGTVGNQVFLGISLTPVYALIHTVLGLTSLNQGFSAPAAATTVAVRTPESAAA